MSRNGPVTSRVCTLLVLLLSASIGVASCGRRERSRVWETRESGSLGEQPIEPLPLTAEFDVAHDGNRGQSFAPKYPVDEVLLRDDLAFAQPL